MNRGIIQAWRLAGILSCILLPHITAFAKASAPALFGDTAYYNEQGQLIKRYGATGKISVSYLVKSTKTVFDIYQPCERDGKGCYSAGNVGPIETDAISNETFRTVRRLIRDGQARHDSVRPHIVEIVGLDILSAMYRNIQNDDYDSSKFREYGGILKHDMTLTVHKGRVAIPGKGRASVTIDGVGITEYHSHPTGWIGKMPPPPRQSVPPNEATGSVTRVENEGSAWFMQGVSDVDADHLKHSTGYVFAMRDRAIYVYVKRKIVAVLSMEFIK